MARSFLTPINLNQNELQNARLQNLASAPASPVLGQTYYDSATANYILTWNGSAWVNALSRSFHTGTQLASTISNLAATVQAYSLNQFAAPTGNVAMGGFTLTGLATPAAAGQAATYDWTLSRPLSAFAAPTGNLPMGGYTLTGLNAAPSAAGQAAEYSWVLSRALNSFTGAVSANVPMNGYTFTGLGTPSAAGQAAEYSWVIGQIQSAAAGIASKPPVACIATANITLSGLQAIDGYTTLAGDRVLVTGQTTASQNGVYNASSGAWTRTTVDGSGTGEIEPGALWLATQGTTYAGSQWRVSTTGTITIGTTSIAIVQFGASSVYAAGNGLSLTGSTFAVSPVAGGGILAAAGGVSVDGTVVVKKYSTTIGDGTSTSFTVTHGLGTTDVHMQVRATANPYAVVECDMQSTSTTACTILFATAPAAGAFRVVVFG